MKLPFLQRQPRPSQGRLWRETGWALGSQIITSGANFASSVLLVRGLGAEHFGQYTLCFLTIMISRNFLNALVLVPMSSMAPKLKARSAAAYRGFALAYAGGFSLASSLILLLGAILIALSDNYGWLGSLLLVFVAANALANLSDFLRRYFFVVEKSALAFLVDVTRFSVQIVLLVWLMKFEPQLLTVNSALLLLAIGSLAGTVIGLWFYGPLRRSPVFLRIMWVRHWRFAKWMLPSTALEAIQGTGPLIILGMMLGDASLGLVRAIQQVANLLNLPINTMVQILPSMASRRLVTSGETALRSFLLRAGAVALVFVFGGVAVLLLLSGLVFRRWMNVDASGAVALLIAFSLLTVITLVRQILNTYLYVHERSKVVSVANFVGAIGSIAVTASLTPWLTGLSVPMGQSFGLLLGLATIAQLQFGAQNNLGHDRK